MLSVEHVTKRYGSFTALEDISLTFTAGVYGQIGRASCRERVCDLV